MQGKRLISDQCSELILVWRKLFSYALPFTLIFLGGPAIPSTLKQIETNGEEGGGISSVLFIYYFSIG